MSVHYKFKSALEYDTVTFDGLHISVKDLKNAILQQKRIGKSTDFDLQVTNAQTKEVYEDENTLIPKNTSLLIARIPILTPKTKPWEGYGGDHTPPPKVDEGPIAKTADLSSLDASEDDKIKAMMSQSTQDYDPSNYMKIRGANQMGVVPPHYRCHKCHQGGHWIKDCTFGQGSDPIEIKKSTGIPRNFLVPVDGPQVPGAMMTPNGQYAVPLLDLQAYNQKVTSAPIVEQKTEIPEDLLCSICSDLLADAVMIPCCGNSFCDECIRSVLLESEDHECPDCHEKDISPDTLIPNRFLRTSVANFGNTTGYVKKSIYREKHEIQKIQNNGTPSAKEFTPPLEPEREPTEKPNPDEKTIISEADSTEHSKNVAKDNNKKLAELETNAEGPPGVSPKTSPKEQQEHREKRSKERERTKERSSKEREFRERKGTRRNSRNRYRGDSPRKNARRMRSSKSPYNSPVSRGEERSGTPTVDEPTTGNGIFNPPVTYGNSTSMPPLMPHMNPMPGGPPPFPSNHPPPISSYPPSQGPPPNYRMPPPGAAPYLPPGSYPPVPPRALYDTSRPPIGGLPPSFNPSFPPRGHREFSRRLRERTPPGVIDDPLAAFNRMLREKDERKRRAKRRSSYSRSRSRSPRSFSRSPVRRRSRSPRMSRRSRSRSRSFSLSRSRSRSFSGSPRGTPYRSPARRSPPPPRRGPSRYKSPLPPSRSPPPRSRHERHRSREFDDDRDYLYKERSRNRDRRSRDRDRYYDSYDDRRGGSRQQQQWAASQQRPPMQDSFYPPEIQPGYPPNRFGAGPPRDFGLPPPPFSQPLPQTIHNIQRQFQDIHPPGVDDDIAPPGVDEPPPPVALLRSPKKEEKAPKRSDKEKKRHDRTPEKKAPSSPKRRSKSNTPDRHNKKKRKESSDREERKRDDSDDDKGKRSKDKKKHKEKKETERKKKKDKKEKHKKESKDKKSKEEFKQVIPKNIEDDFMEDEPRKPEETTSPVKEKHVRTEEEPVVAMKEKTKTDEDRTRKPKEEKSHRLKDEERAKKPKEAEKHKIEETPDEDLTESSPIKKPKERKVEPEEPIQQPSPERKPELYADILEEGVDTEVMEEYGKIEKEINKTGTPEPVHKELEEEEEEEKDVLELHSNDIDLKGLDKSDILAPMPEKSKWEVEEDVPLSPKDTYKSDSKSDKSGKVTNEVLKRAENAIFAKAINAIRPIEIKKISTDRAKLYSGEREVEKTHNKLQITVSSALTDFPSETSQHAARLPVKERLGIKVEDPEKVINLIKKRARTISPFSRRGEGGRNHEPGDRRTETESRSRHDKGRRSRSKQRDSSKDRHRSRAEGRRRSRNKRSEERRDRNRNKSKEKSSTSKRDDDDANDERNRRKRTKSRAESEEPKHKRKDKKPKKEKTKKKEETIKEPTKNEDKEEPAKPSAVTKRKPTIDEASFEPDYDLESHSDEENTKKKAKKHSEEEKSSSSESASSSTSEEERKKKKRKKHRKKRKKESSSSNTSESESDSSDSDKGKKRKKHRKSKKKKKRSKHK